MAVCGGRYGVKISVGDPRVQPPRDHPAAAFLYRLTQKHGVSDAEFLVDGGGYLAALFRHELSGRLNYRERNYIGKWF